MTTPQAIPARLPARLPAVANAKLPATYAAAKAALDECSRIDECQEWADRAEALASYARQADDDSLRKTADRIQGRAIRRCGELLKEIEAARGGRPTEKPGRAPALVSRASAARDAGLSDHQSKTALRVASVPKEDFEALIESEEPPTVTALAERGKATKPKPPIDLEGRDPAEFRLATEVLGTLKDMAELARRADPAAVVRGVKRHEVAPLLANVTATEAWCAQLRQRLSAA